MKRENNPIISIIIPTYNCEQYLAEAMQSVLAQTYHMMLSTVVMHRRLHSTNLGRRERQFQTDYVRILKASLDRRRKRQ